MPWRGHRKDMSDMPGTDWSRPPQQGSGYGDQPKNEAHLDHPRRDRSGGHPTPRHAGHRPVGKLRAERRACRLVGHVWVRCATVVTARAAHHPAHATPRFQGSTGDLRFEPCPCGRHRKRPADGEPGRSANMINDVDQPVKSLPSPRPAGGLLSDLLRGIVVDEHARSPRVPDPCRGCAAPTPGAVQKVRRGRRGWP